MKKTDLQKTIEKIVSGDRRALARAITLVESKNPVHQEKAFALLDALLPYTGKAVRVGISGTPGVGKSTLIESLGVWLIAQGKKVAVLTVDPSSMISFGSILGDKTRMPKLSTDDRAFIRPSPSLGALGGVTTSTREAMLICEAAGFDVIMVETVGVGQAEFSVAAMVDTFVLLMQPGSGDELQAVKKGILELVDIAVINKADGVFKKLADQSSREYLRSMASLKGKNQTWRVPVLKTSAILNQGIEELWKAIERHRALLIQEDILEKKRQVQIELWFLESAMDHILRKIKNDLRTNPMFKRFLALLDGKEISVSHAAYRLFIDLAINSEKNK